jgi:hypothetical protein
LSPSVTVSLAERMYSAPTFIRSYLPSIRSPDPIPMR